MGDTVTRDEMMMLIQEFFELRVNVDDKDERLERQ